MQDRHSCNSKCRACVQSFVGQLCALSVFVKQMESLVLTVVLIERARRIKFDDVTVTDFAMRQTSAMQPVKRGSPY
jgi:hypothetical protein